MICGSTSTCAVVGSAKGVRLPSHDCSMYIYANESFIVGTRNPHMWATTSFLLHGLNAQDRIRYLQPTAVLVDTLDGPLEDVRCELDDIGLDCDNYVDISPEVRDDITERACGLRIGSGTQQTRASTGLFIACYGVLYYDQVVLCGISLQPEYCPRCNRNYPAERGHVPGDTRCLEALIERHGRKLSTTSRELEQRYSMNLVA